MDSKIDSNIFRAYDIRGQYKQTIDRITMMEIGRGLATVLREKGVDSIYVGFDVRTTSYLLASVLISSLSSYGIKTGFSARSLPFGACMFTGWRAEYGAMAFVTASHLPPEWNGVKFYYGDGVGFSEEDILLIRDETIDSQEKIPEVVWNNVGPIKQLDLTNEYVSFFKERLSVEGGLKIVVDCGNGAMCLTAPRVFRELGYDVVELFCDVDPAFPNRSSEPSEESLTELSRQVVKEKVDFGVGFDGDGDRAVIVDNTGKVSLADHVGSFLAQELVRGRKDAIVLANVECSLAVEKALKDIADVVRIKVGHTFLTLEARQRPNVVMGIESSGHMVFPDYFLFDDAMLLPLLLGKLLEKQDRTLAERLREIPSLPKKRAIFPCPDEVKFIATREIGEILAQDHHITTVDGVGIKFEDGWILIRPSNTSAKIRIIVEAETEQRCEELFNRFGKVTEKAIRKFI